MTRTPELTDLPDIQDPSEPRLTPDGRQLVHVLARTTPEGAAVAELWRRAVSPEDGEPEMLTSGTVDAAPAISPDGRWVAFVRRESGGSDLYVMPLAGGVPVRLTEGLLILGDLAFSPDSSHIACTALVDDGPTDPPAPLVVDGELEHKVDGLGWVGAARTHLYVVPVTGGTAVRLTGEGNSSGPAWSPDGTLIAFARIRKGVEGVRLCRQVGLVDPRRPGESVRLPFAPVGVGGPLTWTPDGVAVIAVGTEEFRVGVNRLIRLDVDSGEATVLTADLDRNVMGGGTGYPGGAPAFAADGRLYFCVREGGQTVLHSRELQSGADRTYDVGVGTVISGLTVAGTTAVLRVSDPVTPGELVVLDLLTGTTERLTDTLREALPEVAFTATQPRTFRISDGQDVHGWLLRAPETEGRAPTLIDIHGGPHNAWTGVADVAHLYHQVLADRGWNVLTLNPRGSDGYGEEFYRAVVGGWGEVDLADFLEPLDALVEEGLADPERLAVAGYSYGGFMTCRLTTRTQRFRAAVAGGLVCDHEAMNASSDLGAMLHELEIGGREQSRGLAPIHDIDEVRTPTLVLHGQEDQRCPLAQAEAWFTRLRENGVATRMVVYPGGAHAFFLTGPVAHRSDFNSRIVEWLEEHAG